MLSNIQTPLVFKKDGIPMKNVKIIANNVEKGVANAAKDVGFS
jgi:hypothetical protein